MRTGAFSPQSAFHTILLSPPLQLTQIPQVETGSKNHEVVPTPLIVQLSGLRTGSNGAHRSISILAKAGLIAKEKNVKYDGYRLTYGGLDYLSLHSHTKSDSIIHLGSQMGVGKESDIYLVTSPAQPPAPPRYTPNPTNSSRRSSVTSSRSSTFAAQQRPEQAILKIHRLGRTSFRTLRTNRAYHGTRTAHVSWQNLSRLSAEKEFAAMYALHAAGFPVPRPIACNRHTVVMSLVPGLPLRQVPISAFRGGKEAKEEEISRLYGDCMELALRLADVGLIHGDFNEFNILIENVPEPEDVDEEENENDAAMATTTTINTSATEEPPSSPNTNPNLNPPKPMIPHLIDFPQITSLSHPNAAFYFSRDIACIKDFFRKRYHFESLDPGPTFADAQARLERASGEQGGQRRLDVDIAAAGFNRKQAKELEIYYRDRAAEENADAVGWAMDGGGGDLDSDEEQVNDDDAASKGEESSKNYNVAFGTHTIPSGTDTHEVMSPVTPSLHSGDLHLSSRLDPLSMSSRPSPQTRLKAAVGWAI